MGMVYENITLRNAVDVAEVKRGLITESEIRQIEVTAMVDTGAGTLIINENMRQELGLEVESERPAKLADETRTTCQITEPVIILWQNRSAVARAVVLPGVSKVLLGAIPLEEMDVMVDPKNQRLVGIHGDEIICQV
jgi:clan AA aspartic protease